MEYAIAVLDVGKTNKKLFIFDDQLNQITSVYRTFPAEKRNGILIEDVDGLLHWFYDELSSFAQQYPIRVISVSTHGAAFVGVDEKGHRSLPMIDYTHDPGEDFHRRFYGAVGDRDDLQRTTATLELKPLINPAKLLMYTREQFPDDFAATRWFLPYPGYFAMQLTGEPTADYTYVGCHTYLWDFHRDTWSTVADRLGIRERLPQKIGSPREALAPIRPQLAERLGLSSETVVAYGIHDSNAALLPYLVTEQEPFLLNSTGTWCVVMRPAEKVAFAENEIGKSVFFNRSVEGKPVKTAILMAGLEFETYTKILKERHKVDVLPDYNAAVYRRVTAERSAFILPSIVVGSGQFPESRPRVIEDGEEYTLDEIQSGERVPKLFDDLDSAYAALNLSIAAQSRVAFERVGAAEVVNAYTEGGFRKNRDYNALMAAIFPKLSMSLTGIPEASAFGAAMAGKMAHDRTSLESIAALLTIEKEHVEPADVPELAAYIDRFLELV